MGRKSALSEKQWQQIGARLLKGESGRSLSREFDISEAAIRKRGKLEDWARVQITPQDRQAALSPSLSVDRSGFLYVIFIDTGLERMYKIGIAKHFSTRFGQHQCASPFEIRVAACYFVGNADGEERTLHDTYRAKRIRGEWFSLTREDLKDIAARALLE